MPRRSRTAKSPKSSPARLAVDLGGTKVVAGWIGPTGRLVRRGERIEHGNAGFEPVLAAVIAAVRAQLADRKLPAGPVGVSVAAQVDPPHGTVVHAPNLQWRNAPLGRRLSAALERPVRLLNDAQSAALAEWTAGAGRGARDLVCISLGTGVGGGIVANGQLVAGARYAAGEVGHLTLVAGGRRCRCPSRGCLEAYVGGWAIAERMREAYDLERAPGRPAEPGVPTDARQLFEAADAGDLTARRLVSETEQYLADGVVGIANALNPARIVLVGGLVDGHPRFVETTSEAVRSRCQPSAAAATVVAGRFGADAPLVGAGLWAGMA